MQGLDYKEASPQLLLQAFLSNALSTAAGRVEREYGLGRGRTDLPIVWPQGRRDAQVRHRVQDPLREARNSAIDDGLGQTAR